MKFCSIASGSSGNCIYVATDHTRILIDAGISGKKIEAGLAALSESGEKIDALFITHEHMDHIKGAGIFSRRFDIPIYATMGTWQAMESQLGHIIPQNKRLSSLFSKQCPLLSYPVRQSKQRAPAARFSRAHAIIFFEITAISMQTF